MPRVVDLLDLECVRDGMDLLGLVGVDVTE